MLGAVSLACGILAIVAAIIAIVFAPTDIIDLANGIAVAGMLALAGIGTGIAAKSFEADLATKNCGFFKNASEKKIDQSEEADLPVRLAMFS